MSTRGINTGGLRKRGVGRITETNLHFSTRPDVSRARKTCGIHIAGWTDSFASRRARVAARGTRAVTHRFVVTAGLTLGVITCGWSARAAHSGGLQPPASKTTAD